MNFRNIFDESDINEKVIALVKKTPFLAVSLIIHLGIFVVLMSIKFSKEVRAAEIAPLEVRPIDQNISEENDILNEISQSEIEYSETQKFESHHDLIKMDFNRLEKSKDFDALNSSNVSAEIPIPCVNVSCKESDHNESANDDPIHHTIKGDGLIYKGRMPLKGKPGSKEGQGGAEGQGVLNVIGLGGGSGGFSSGMFGHRFGGKANLIKKAGGDPTAVETSVVNALKWLARHQHKDGYWDGMHFNSACGGSVICGDAGNTDVHNIGLTGLAVLAFLSYGITPQIAINQQMWKNDDIDKYVYIDKYTNKKINVTEVVRKGLMWLKNNQKNNGIFFKGSEEEVKLNSNYMYDHAIATLAMAEGCGLTNNSGWCDSARKGAEFLIRAKKAYQGWRYTEQYPDSDMSVTGWAIMALKSVGGSGKYNISKDIFTGVLDWMDKAMIRDDDTYIVTYTENGHQTSCFQDESNCNYGGDLSMTGVGMLVRMLADPQSSAKGEGFKILKEQAKLLKTDLPTTDIVRKDGKNPRDYYYWYYATLALYLLDGPEGFSDGNLGVWKEWNKNILSTLIKLQEKDSKICSFGSFPAKNDKWGMAIGRVYSTAINTLTLEVYFRYKNVFKFMLSGVSKKQEDEEKSKNNKNKK